MRLDLKVQIRFISALSLTSSRGLVEVDLIAGFISRTLQAVYHLKHRLEPAAVTFELLRNRLENG